MAKKLRCAKIELINHFIRAWMLLLPVSDCERLTSNVKDKDKNMTATKKIERNSPTTRQFALKGSCLVLFLPLAFCSVVITHVISVHRCRNKDRASRPITSMKSTSRQTCVSKISTSDRGYLSGEQPSVPLWNWMVVFAVSVCIRDRTEKPEIDSICWWSSPKSNWSFVRLCNRTNPCAGPGFRILQMDEWLFMLVLETHCIVAAYTWHARQHVR